MSDLDDTVTEQERSSLDDLLAASINVGNDSRLMKSQLDKLFENQEEIYQNAVQELKAKHNAIIEEAQLLASKVVFDAEGKATQIVATAAARGEEIETQAHEKGKKLVDHALEECEELLIIAKEKSVAWEADRVIVQQFQPKLKLDVGGNRFTTSLATLTRFPDSRIGSIFSGYHMLPMDEEGYHFIDRDGTHFRYILNFLRSPEAFMVDLSATSIKELKLECEFYGILDLMFPFAPLDPFTLHNQHNQQFTVTENSQRIWCVKDVPIQFCKHCHAADYSACNVPDHHAHYCFVRDFKRTVESKGGEIRPEQPSLTQACRVCGQL